MAEGIKSHHRLRIETLGGKRKFEKLDHYLGKLSGKGLDVAAIPFHVLDYLLTQGDAVEFAALVPLARHTFGGQPRLMAAVLADLDCGTQDSLREIVCDTAAHPMTRFEAMGWAVFLAHRSEFPIAGVPARDVFQYWDDPTPPSEVSAGRRLWEGAADEHVWYDDAAAFAFIADEFGQGAAKDYAKLWHPALKSDVFRLYRLAKLGGVYCDADSRPEYRAAAFVKQAGDRVWASSMTRVPNCAAINGFMAAPAGSLLIFGFLDYVLSNLRDAQARGVFWLSGPGALTVYLYRNAGRYDVGLLSQGCLKSEVFRQFDADYKHSELNWRVFEHNRNINNEAGLSHALGDVSG